MAAASPAMRGASTAKVTGTEGTTAAERNPSQRAGEPRSFAGSGKFKALARQEDPQAARHRHVLLLEDRREGHTVGRGAGMSSAPSHLTPVSAGILARAPRGTVIPSEDRRTTGRASFQRKQQPRHISLSRRTRAIPSPTTGELAPEAACRGDRGCLRGHRACFARPGAPAQFDDGFAERASEELLRPGSACIARPRCSRRSGRPTRMRRLYARCVLGTFRRLIERAFDRIHRRARATAKAPKP